MQVDPCAGRRMFIPTFDRSSQCREERKAVISQLVSAFRVLCSLPLQNASLVGISRSIWLLTLALAHASQPARHEAVDDGRYTVLHQRALDGGLQFRPGWRHVNNCRPGCDPATAGKHPRLHNELGVIKRVVKGAPSFDRDCVFQVVYTPCVESSKTPQNAGPTTAWHRPPQMIPLKTGIMHQK